MSCYYASDEEWERHLSHLLGQVCREMVLEKFWDEISAMRRDGELANAVRDWLAARDQARDMEARALELLRRRFGRRQAALAEFIAERKAEDASQ